MAKFTQYQMNQIINNTRKRELTMNPKPFINVGRYNITIPDILSTLTKILKTNNMVEFPVPSVNKVLFIADGIESDTFSRYGIGEIQIYVTKVSLKDNLTDLVYEIMQVDNKLAMVIFRNSLNTGIKTKDVANLYSICKAFISLYKLDGLECFWGSIYMNTIMTAPLGLTCKIWEKVTGDLLTDIDFDPDFYDDSDKYLITKENIDSINQFAPEYTFNFGLLNDKV